MYPLINICGVVSQNVALGPNGRQPFRPRLERPIIKSDDQLYIHSGWPRHRENREFGC